jgi:hypothetical protein|tara:strand:- start:140 stop:337 length:198 start_codon:yes stop_codon:yes gene_type:complete
MRILTLNNGLDIMVGLDESHLLERLSDITLKSELEERDQQLASQMVTRGLLNRTRKDGKIAFTKN